MAPRKAAKHTNTEVVDRAAETGDASPPKRKKAVTATDMNKSDEEKQIRFPRAAKIMAKNDQIEATDMNSIAVAKNAKTKTKPTSPKNATVSAKTNSKTKSAATKRNKEVKEKLDSNLSSAEAVKNAEETDTKKTRTKAVTKKAGIVADGESKGKAKGRTKKGAANKNTDSLETSIVKKRKQANVDAVTQKKTKSEAKTTSKKNETDGDTKNKVVNNKIKDIGNETEELLIVTKTIKKGGDEKPTKSIAKKAKGRKNKVSPEDISKDEEDSKAAGEPYASKEVHTSDIENQETLNDELEETELAQTLKKGKTVKKKGKAMPQKKVTKTRGKAASQNTDTFADDHDIDTEKAVKNAPKKTNKENVSSTTVLRKGRGKKETTISNAKDESAEKSPEDQSKSGEKKISNSLETLISNNNVQKFPEKDNEKESDSEKDDAKHMKISGTLKETDESSIMIKTEVTEDNVSSIREEEN